MRWKGNGGSGEGEGEGGDLLEMIGGWGIVGVGGVWVQD